MSAAGSLWTFAVAVLLVGVSAGCAGQSGGTSDSTGSSSSSSNDPAFFLAHLDGSSADAVYVSALDRLAAECTEGRVKVAGYVDTAYRDLERNGVTDETRLTVMKHLARSIPPSAAPTRCDQVAAAYLTLREPG